MMESILNSLLGNITLTQYIVNSIFIVIGVLISIRVGALNRDRNSPNTPFKFSYKFLTRDNIVRAIGSICIAFVVIRFGEQITGKTLDEFGAFLVGIGFDQIIAKLKAWQKGARE